MPYIIQEQRRKFFAAFEEMHTMDSPGELNYVVSTIVSLYLLDRGESYQTMNDIVGALDSAKIEFQRRVVAPYEDQKIEANGDIF